MGLRIVEPVESEEASFGRFEDRTAAARLLAEELEGYRATDTLVIGLPRGGVVVADAIARALSVDLDVLVSRKLRAPGQPELAIGALAEGGFASWNEDVISALGLSDEDCGRELQRMEHELTARSSRYRMILPRAPIHGRTVILTDDGVATGATLRAAAESIARAGAARVVIALPGGPRSTLEELAAMPGVEEVVALVAPEPFHAVGQLYVSFGQVSDGRVCEILRAAVRRHETHSISYPAGAA